LLDNGRIRIRTGTVHLTNGSGRPKNIQILVSYGSGTLVARETKNTSLEPVRYIRKATRDKRQNKGDIFAVKQEEKTPELHGKNRKQRVPVVEKKTIKSRKKNI
jgi:hypothetical protein